MGILKTVKIFSMRHAKSGRDILSLSRLKGLVFIAVLPLFVLPMAACTTLTTEPATIAEPVGHFSQSGEVPLQSHWWKSLPDAQLQTLQQTALAANPGLLATQARLAEAGALARKTGAQLLPQINAGLSSSNTSSSSTDGTSSHTGSIAASYELDLWGGLDAATAGEMPGRITGIQERVDRSVCCAALRIPVVVRLNRDPAHFPAHRQVARRVRFCRSPAGSRHACR